MGEIPKSVISFWFSNNLINTSLGSFVGKTLTPTFSIGDHVRITKKKKIFDKGYTQRWTDEIFAISKIQLTISVAYKITDYNGEQIQGSFYEQELQKSKHEIFRIENNKTTRK